MTDNGVCFLDEVFIITDGFTPSQVLNFGSLAYIVDDHSEGTVRTQELPSGEHII
jgi:hypothetical protein